MVWTIDNIETPALIIDEALALRNIRQYQDYCDKAGLQLRPHIKTHKSVRFARAQTDAGAVGITCQKISEAEAMADGGLNDILITFNILSAQKLTRLRALAERIKNLSVVADNSVVVAGLGAGFAGATRQLPILVECDTGAARNGAQSPAEAAELATYIVATAGLSFAGLMTYPAPGGQADVVSFMNESKALLADAGIDCPAVSGGGSPDMWQAETGGVITEYRIGTYIYNDRSLVERGTCTLDDCAAHVLATVVSRPTATRAVIDAGSKALTSDLLGLDGHGHVVGHPDARITGLSEEHGIVQLNPDDSLAVGDRIQILPNHICVVSNMFNHAWLRSDSGQFTNMPIDARGLVT